MNIEDQIKADELKLKQKKIIYVTLDNGEQMTVAEYEKHRGNVNWYDELFELRNSLRVMRFLKIRYDNYLHDPEKRVLNLNNPKHRKKIRENGYKYAPNFGKNSWRCLKGYLDKTWPWDNYEQLGK